MTKKITILIAVLCTVVAVASFASARGARRALEQTIKSNHAYSNQLASAQATLAERDAAIQTLRIHGDLAAKDMQAAGERYTNVLTKLSEARHAITEANREAQTQRKENAVWLSDLSAEREAKSRALQQIASLESELAARSSDLSALKAEMEALRHKANQNAARYSELLQKWADPSALEAQFHNLRQGSRGKSLPGKGQLILQPDGSVVVAK